jgi:S1-C subfamily serine protease
VRIRPVLLLLAAALALAGNGCAGGDDGDGDGDGGERGGPPSRTVPVPRGRVEVIRGLPGGAFDPGAIYRREAPGVVTVISVFGGERSGRGLGSGFVLNGQGEIATNAHVVLEGEGRSSDRADEVYVQFADRNQVRARVVGTDAESDVALLRVNPAGLTLRPLPLGSSTQLAVGQPVVAIGSPFGEPQSLSVGVISALDRTIDSLTDFQISDAIQTDAAINRGNSGGPLVDARGRVIGINSQIRTAGGGSEGVGFAVPVDTVKRSLRELRADGKVDYAFIGVSSVPLYPQLARRLGLPVDRGALVQEVVEDGPADDAGIRAGDERIRFQGQGYREGGDVIVSVAGRPIREESDLARVLTRLSPGQQVAVALVRGGDRRQVRVKLEERP